MSIFRMVRCVFLLTVFILSFSGHSVFAEKKDIVLDVGFLPILSQIPIVVTYEKDRLNLKETRLGIYAYSSYTSLEAAMRVGSIDIASLPIGIALSMSADGYDVLIIGSCHKGGSRLMAQKAGAFDMLKEAIIGVPGLDSNESLELMRVLDGVGLRFGRDYHPIEVPFSSVLNDMKTKELDAFYLPEPFGILAEKQKIGFPVEGQKGKLTGTQGTVLVIKKNTLAAKRKSVEAWLKQLVTACRFIESDIQSSGGVQVAIIQQPWCNLPKEIVAEALSKRTGDLIFGGFVADEHLISDYSNLAGKIQLLSKSVIVKDIINTELMEKANK